MFTKYLKWHLAHNKLPITISCISQQAIFTYFKRNDSVLRVFFEQAQYTSGFLPSLTSESTSHPFRDTYVDTKLQNTPQCLSFRSRAFQLSDMPFTSPEFQSHFIKIRFWLSCVLNPSASSSTPSNHISQMMTFPWLI